MHYQRATTMGGAGANVLSGGHGHICGSVRVGEGWAFSDVLSLPINEDLARTALVRSFVCQNGGGGHVRARSGLTLEVERETRK